MAHFVAIFSPRAKPTTTGQLPFLLPFMPVSQSSRAPVHAVWTTLVGILIPLANHPRLGPVLPVQSGCEWNGNGRARKRFHLARLVGCRVEYGVLGDVDHDSQLLRSSEWHWEVNEFCIFAFFFATTQERKTETEKVLHWNNCQLG